MLVYFHPFLKILYLFFKIYIIIQMITIDHLSKHQPSDTQSLDLRSSKTQKIHHIDSLQRFHNLRQLNLANNMVSRIQNLSSLVHLRILNLEFNQISRLEGIKALTRLEELFLSYNSVDQISSEIKHNNCLRVLHLAYNDLKSIEDIRPLSTLPSLTILSLIGNPFLAALNYVAFVKMLIPSLLLLDDRDASQSIIAANVYPHEEIFILRDALNKLLDQRNNATHIQASHHRNTPPQFRQFGNTSKGEENSPQIIKEKIQKDQNRDKDIDKQHILELIEQWMSNYQRKTQTKRLQINDLSESYSNCMKKSTKKAGDKYQAQLIAKINKYRIQEQKGQLNEDRKQKLLRLSKELQKNDSEMNQTREQSKNILQMLKNKENDYGRTKQKMQILRDLKQKIQQNQEIDTNKILISHILYGKDTQQLNYKDLKRFLYDNKGVIFYLQTLSKIIFGEQAEADRIFRLKQFLGDKSLIQIINNLKEMGLKHKKDKKKYQKQRTKLIEKFETEAQQLCDQWKQLEKEKLALRNSRNSQNFEGHYHNKSKSMLEQRYSIVQAQQRNRIMMLKKEKDHYQNKIQEMQQKYESLHIQFERKYKQLEQFQKFFEQFKNERQIVNGLKEEIETTSKQLNKKKQLLTQLQSNVKELSMKQENLLEKSSFYQRKSYEKAQELKLIEQKMRNNQQKVKKANDEFNLKSYQYIGMQEQITKVVQQLRDYDKRIQRQKSTLQIYEQKLRNLNELQNNKRSNLSNLQHDIETQRKHLKQLSKKVEQAQQKLNHCIESNYQYQLKIQQNKKSLESLTDVNKTVSDMMERQTQLKRSIFELELEYQHLQEIKGRMINQIKLQYDDQDDSL